MPIRSAQQLQRSFLLLSMNLLVGLLLGSRLQAQESTLPNLAAYEQAVNDFSSGDQRNFQKYLVDLGDPHRRVFFLEYCRAHPGSRTALALSNLAIFAETPESRIEVFRNMVAVSLAAYELANPTVHVTEVSPRNSEIYRNIINVTLTVFEKAHEEVDAGQLQTLRDWAAKGKRGLMPKSTLTHEQRGLLMAAPIWPAKSVSSETPAAEKNRVLQSFQALFLTIRAFSGNRNPEKRLPYEFPSIEGSQEMHEQLIEDLFERFVPLLLIPDLAEFTWKMIDRFIIDGNCDLPYLRGLLESHSQSSSDSQIRERGQMVVDSLKLLDTVTATIASTRSMHQTDAYEFIVGRLALPLDHLLPVESLPYLEQLKAIRLLRLPDVWRESSLDAALRRSLWLTINRQGVLTWLEQDIRSGRNTPLNLLAISEGCEELFVQEVKIARSAMEFLEKQGDGELLKASFLNRDSQGRGVLRLGHSAETILRLAKAEKTMLEGAKK
jgi:hypothetical protein